MNKHPPAPVTEGAQREAVALDAYADEIMKDASEHERSVIADLTVIMSEDGYWNGPPMRERKDFWTRAIASAARSLILNYRKAAVATPPPDRVQPERVEAEPLSVWNDGTQPTKAAS